MGKSRNCSQVKEFRSPAARSPSTVRAWASLHPTNDAEQVPGKCKHVTKEETSNEAKRQRSPHRNHRGAARLRGQEDGADNKAYRSGDRCSLRPDRGETGPES